MNAIVEQSIGNGLSEAAVVGVLRNSLYPGAKDESIYLVLDYCRAAGLDPMQKPVHIVPMWDKSSGGMRDVIMPGVGLYRTQAARTGQFAGMSEPEFGPVVVQSLGGVEVSYPEWAKVTVKRALANGIVAEFTAIEYWMENYAVRGGKEKSIAPNAMWMKRPRGQVAKCAAAQALRLAFPEQTGSQPTADEMEGKTLYENYQDHSKDKNVVDAEAKPADQAQRAQTTISDERLTNAIKAISDGAYTATELEARFSLTVAQQSTLDSALVKMAGGTPEEVHA